MKVTVKDILQIKAGKAKSFSCDTPLQARSGQSQVSYVKKYHQESMPSDVVDYQTSINGCILTVMAVAK